jgi:hypothetical protein
MIVSLGTSSNGTSSERDHHDVPYPPPDAFLLPQQPRFEAGEDDTEDDDDDDAQSIKSYGSDHIRQSVSNEKNIVKSLASHVGSKKGRVLARL